MSLRVKPARWFEAVVPRPSVARSVEILAATGRVQLESEPVKSAALADYSACAAPLEAWRNIRRRYLGYWPEPRFEPTSRDALMESRFAAALRALEAWVAQASPHVEQIEALRHERHELRRLADFLQLVQGRDDLDLAAVATAHAPLAGALLVASEGAAIPALSEQVITHRADAQGFAYLLVLGPAAEIAELAQSLGGRDTRAIPLPAWLPTSPQDALVEATSRIGRIDARLEQEYGEIGQLNERAGLPAVLGELRRLEWLTPQLSAIPVSEYLARITGWTSAARTDELATPLNGAGIPGVVNFFAAPHGLYPPTLPENPWWARPFELFVKLLGTPGRDEADPTPLVAFVAPLLFGYMFADVGQGLALLAAGVLLRKRWPALGMLIPGGALAAVFGFVFGSVFAREDLLAPLWVAPLAAPLPVLALPLGFGALLVVAGLLLSGVEEHWAGRGRIWLETEAGLIALYLGLLAALVAPTAGLTLAAAGLVWFVAGPVLVPRRQRHESLGAHAGELFERVLQLGVNTLSFARVGAFAIAHAGLAAALTSLSLAAGHVGGLFVLVIGNAVILILEGMVVAIQTTRLVLFEFFVRFVRAEGRPFQALGPPSAI